MPITTSTKMATMISSIVTVLIGIIVAIFVLVVIGIAAFENTPSYEDPDSYYYEDDPVFE